jgi:hypothetical protein
MTFRKGGAKKRRDKNESVIIHALEAVGVQVWQLSGRAVPDLLCWYRGHPVVLEVKTATGKQQPTQVGTPWPIVRSVQDALDIVLPKHGGRR